jgi:Cu/Ag efflux protein CusF
VEEAVATVYPGKGVIRNIDLERSEVTLEHEAVENLMPGMTMSFRVSPEIALDRFLLESEVAFGLVNEPAGFRIVEMVALESDFAPISDDAVSSFPESGQRDYVLYCSSCHGETGNGDGPLAGSLNPKPAKHSDGEYMNSLSDAHMFQVIKLGGTAVGKSPMMAGWGGTLSEDQISGLVAFIRSLAEPPHSSGPSGER